MKLQGDDYSKRLEAFSNFTIVLISGITTREMHKKASEITTDSELNEEQVIERLIELIRSDSEPLPTISREDALRIVCDALEEGHFYPLFEILKDESVLIRIDDNDNIFGSRSIIEFLVNERIKHLYSSDEKTITCDILRVAEGERYGIGEKCILLTYHLQNGKRQFRIIKVYCDNNQISKLETFKPFGPLSLIADAE